MRRIVEGRPYQEALGRLRDKVRRPPEEARRTLVDRAVGLLAGRVGCGLEEAHSHLQRLAAGQQRDVYDVAADLVELLEILTPQRALPIDVVATALRGTVHSGDKQPPPTEPPPTEPPPVTPPPTSATPTSATPATGPVVATSGSSVTIQQVFDTLPGGVALLTPIRDAAGAVVDLVIEAASPESVDSEGRLGTELLGARLDEYSDVDSELWRAYLAVLETGEPQQVGPIARRSIVDGEPRDVKYFLRAHRLGTQLVVSWVRHDSEARMAERIAQTEELGNLGWGEWALATGEIVWSDHMYRIFERDPALGPMSNDETDALALPEDLQLRGAAAEEFARGNRLDVVYRIRLGGRIKYLRAVIDAMRDSTGQPLKIYGIIQDVTARETTLARLAEVERQLDEQRRTLAAEHRIASRLQRIILPLPETPVDLPGLRVALRYVPAEELSNVGGDWYQAAALPDGAVLLAVGDVAGHGIPAATTMAQLRHALRALAVTTTDPARLMSHLNHLLCDLEGETTAQTATAVIARYDPESRTLTWAQAGHPAPLCARAGVTAPLPRPDGPLLGVATNAAYTSATIPLEPGDVLLLYTDGLVEHRGLALEEGLARVIDAMNEAIGSAPDQPLAAILGRLRPANPNDDTCILAARPTPPVPPSSSPPASLPPANPASTTPEDNDG